MNQLKKHIATALIASLSFSTMAAIHSIHGSVDEIRYFTFGFGAEGDAPSWNKEAQGSLWFTLDGAFDSGSCDKRIYFSGQDSKAFDLLLRAQQNHLKVTAVVSDQNLFIGGWCRLQYLTLAPATKKTSQTAANQHQ